MTGTIDATIPIKETLDIPLNGTMRPRVYFDSHVPIKTTIPVKETLKIDQQLPIDTKDKVKILGKEVTLPLKGTIPAEHAQ